MADLKKEVRFDKIMGQSVTVEMRLLDGTKRYFNGIVNRFSQGPRDEKFTALPSRDSPQVLVV